LAKGWLGSCSPGGCVGGERMCVLEALGALARKKCCLILGCLEAVILHNFSDNSVTGKCCIVVRSARLWKNEVRQRKHRLSILLEAAARDLANTHLSPTTHKSTPRDSRPLHVQKHQRYFSTQPIIVAIVAMFHSFPLFVCGPCPLLASKASLFPKLFLTPHHGCHYFSHVNFET
jgi:hypothetical protein